jgi:hypothetical protein
MALQKPPVSMRSGKNALNSVNGVNGTNDVNGVNGVNDVNEVSIQSGGFASGCEPVLLTQR